MPEISMHPYDPLRNLNPEDIRVAVKNLMTGQYVCPGCGGGHYGALNHMQKPDADVYVYSCHGGSSGKHGLFVADMPPCGMRYIFPPEHHEAAASSMRSIGFEVVPSSRLPWPSCTCGGESTETHSDGCPRGDHIHAEIVSIFDYRNLAA